MSARGTRSAVTLAVLLTLATGCGTGTSSGGVITRPSVSASFAPSRSLPTVSRPTASKPTRPPASAAPTTEPPTTSGPTTKPTSKPTPKPTPTASGPTTEPTTTQPTTEPTQAGPTSGPPTQSPTEAPSSEVTESVVTEPSESTAPVVPDDSSGDGSSTAWWWLAALAALVVGAVVTLLLVRRSRTRQAWATDLEAAEQDVAWFGRDLVPALRGSGSFAGVSGGWAVASPRVQALDDRLTQLLTTAPTEVDRARAATLHDAVRTARERMAALLVAGETSQWSLALDDVQAPLLAVLVPATGPDGSQPAG